MQRPLNSADSDLAIRNVAPMSDISPVEAIAQLSNALEVLRRSKVIRSARFVGDLGEWYVATLYDGELPRSQAQKGWDVIEKSTGQRLQVKTQTFDSTNQWNYLTTPPELFDRLVIVVLTTTLLIRDMYDIPAQELPKVLRIGKERRHIYRFAELATWRVKLENLVGFKIIESSHRQRQL
jgi:hypothetical protein